MVTFSSTDPGTPAETWHSDSRYRGAPHLSLPDRGGLVVVAAHPDDETLGAAGLMQRADAEGKPVVVVIVTDGADSHPSSPTHDAARLAAVREEECRAAVALLAPTAEVHFLGFPDGAAAANRSEIESALASIVNAAGALACTFRGDGHGDHRVVGEICADLARSHRVDLFEYPIWLWHWATPDDEAVPWAAMTQLPLTADEQTAKRRALDQHATQLAALGPEPGNEVLLSPGFIDNFLDRREHFVTTSPPPDSSSLGSDYFEDLYETSDDPWRLATRWYELRKRQLTIASLPAARFSRALEVGCSVGVLTADLAEVCDELVAIDISERAAARARTRTAQFPQVSVLAMDAGASLPPGEFDLIVLSEVGYYFSREALDDLIARLEARLAPNGVIVACHWQHDVDDYPLSGAEVHRALDAGLSLPRIVDHREKDFHLEVFHDSPLSVAEREGLVG